METYYREKKIYLKHQIRDVVKFVLTLELFFSPAVCKRSAEDEDVADHYEISITDLRSKVFWYQVHL
uniref:Uncharacterized protein n=1 Tax=Seriola dumerili TaxID=41447 RepID=A0A3B4TP08_SERDU